MIDKQKVLGILQKYDIDEMWVDFDNPWSYDKKTCHFNGNIIVVKSDIKENDSVLKEGPGYQIVCVFDPDALSDEDDIAASVNLMWWQEFGRLAKKYEGQHDGYHKVYDKEVGLIG